MSGTLEYEVWDDNTEESVTRTIKAHYEVCPRCEGKGSHTNPNIDGNGITASEMAELGEDFLDDYLGGMYDVTCSECNGLRVVLVPNDDAPNKAEYDRVMQEKWEADAADRSEAAYFGAWD